MRQRLEASFGLSGRHRCAPQGYTNTLDASDYLFVTQVGRVVTGKRQFTPQVRDRLPSRLVQVHANFLSRANERRKLFGAPHERRSRRRLETGGRRCWVTLISECPSSFITSKADAPEAIKADAR
jgi:hypothetical protein